MQQLLIVAATEAELSPLLAHYKIQTPLNRGIISLNTEKNIHLLITGVGMVNTAYELGKHLSDNFSLIINAGICGAFNRNLSIGEVVVVKHDILSEMGAENDTEFIEYKNLGLPGRTEFNHRLLSNYQSLQQASPVTGITVNKVHGNEKSIAAVKQLFGADTESMEGAAFFRACENYKADYIQIRTVSNYVEKRNREAWNIPLAIKNLNHKLLEIISEINQ